VNLYEKKRHAALVYILGEYEEADSIVNPGVEVRWIYARPKDELAALALEFGFGADGTVAETQKAFATLVSTGSFPKSV